MSDVITIPDPVLVLLVGVAGCGKSTFARRHFSPTEVVSSDALRAAVSDDPTDQSATRDAFALVRTIVEMRLRRGRTTVVDATNLEWRARRPSIETAARLGVPAVAIVLDVPLEVCLDRDARRGDREVGAQVLARQAVDLERTLRRLPEEGYAAVEVLDPEQIDAAEFVRRPTRSGA